MIGIPCNACSNGFCGNCVGDKLETMEFIESAEFHCGCAKDGHPNSITKKNTNKNVFSSKKDTDEVHPRTIQSDTDDDFRDDD